MNIYRFTTSLLVATGMTLMAAERPNVVIIYGDDVGYGDVGAYGSKMIPTPNIDKIVSEGLMFTDGHCSAATCTPSRFSMLTGVHGFRNGVRILPPNAPLCIPQDKITLPKLFKKAGYTTAIIGKWHLGIGERGTPLDWNGEIKPGPLEIGFDYSFLLPSTNDRVPCVYVVNHKVLNLDPDDPLYVTRSYKSPDEKSTRYPNGNTDREAMTYYQSSHGHNQSVINGIGRIGYQWGGKSALWDDETMADEFVKQTKKYIAQQKGNDEPFFLYFASQDIHVPRAPHPRFQGKTELGHRGDAMVQFDWATGEIMKAIKENGFEENTIVIFSSDNGPVYDDGYQDGTTVNKSSKESDGGHDASGIYSGGKYQIYEGGTRVPFIVKWPAKIKPGKSDAMMNQIDFIASFADLLDVKLADDEARDSRNMLQALLGKDSKGLPYMLEEASGVALRKGVFKYIPGRKAKKGKVSPLGKLYDLSTDPGEKKNIAAANADKAKELHALLVKLHQSKVGVRNEAK
ncbi:MAG: arylsulfatase A [Crocinitomicaceae bacterium]|jgi:arylsulfatase A